MKERIINPENACETTLSGGGAPTKYLKHNDFDPVLKKHIFDFGQMKVAFTRLRKANKRGTSFVSLRSETKSSDVKHFRSDRSHAKLTQSPAMSSQTKFRFAHSYGFTLAETMIVFVILGIVAVLMVNSLVQSYQEKTFIVKLKKVYSQLQNSLDIEEAKNGKIDTWDSFLCKPNEFWSNCRNKSVELIMDNIPQLKPCSSQKNGRQNAANDGCYISNDDECIYSLKGQKTTSCGGVYYSYYTNRYLTKDGAFLWFNINNSGSFTYEGYTTHVYSEVALDVNGKKGPNRIGKDIFTLYLTKDGIMARGGSSSQSYLNYGSYYSHNNLCNFKNNGGSACTRWALEKGNMQYLHKDTKWY